MASDPLHFYAHATSGTQLIVASLATDAAKVQSTIDQGRTAGKPVFVAACTGGSHPWYTVTQVAG